MASFRRRQRRGTVLAGVTCALRSPWCCRSRCRTRAAQRQGRSWSRRSERASSTPCARRTCSPGACVRSLGPGRAPRARRQGRHDLDGSPGRDPLEVVGGLRAPGARRTLARTVRCVAHERRADGVSLGGARGRRGAFARVRRSVRDERRRLDAARRRRTARGCRRRTPRAADAPIVLRRRTGMRRSPRRRPHERRPAGRARCPGHRGSGRRPPRGRGERRWRVSRLLRGRRRGRDVRAALGGRGRQVALDPARRPARCADDRSRSRRARLRRDERPAARDGAQLRHRVGPRALHAGGERGWPPVHADRDRAAAVGRQRGSCRSGVASSRSRSLARCARCAS